MQRMRVPANPHEIDALKFLVRDGKLTIPFLADKKMKMYATAAEVRLNLNKCPNNSLGPPEKLAKKGLIKTATNGFTTYIPRYKTEIVSAK